MHKTAFMGVGKAACRLDGNVQNSLLHFLLCSLIKRPVTDSVLQAPVVHPLRKDRRHSSDLSHIIAGDNVGVQAEIDPVFAFGNKLLFPLLTAFGKKTRLRAFHRQINIPAFMVNSPHAAHTAVNRIVEDFIGIKNRISLPNFLIGDRFRFLPFFSAFSYFLYHCL